MFKPDGPPPQPSLSAAAGHLLAGFRSPAGSKAAFPSAGSPLPAAGAGAPRGLKGSVT